MRSPFTRSIPKSAPPEPAGAYPVALVSMFTVSMVGLAIVTRQFGWDPSQIAWYLARASGISLYLMLWASTVLGLGLTTHLLDRGLNRSLVYSLHTYSTVLGFSFLAMHLLSLALDAYTAMTLEQLLIPFRSGFREPWTGLGVLAAWMMLLIALSFPLKRITGYGFWRKMHWLTLPLMLIALLHGIGSGTDTSSSPIMVLYVSTGTITLFFLLYRVLRGERRATLPGPMRPAPLDRMTDRSPRKIQAIS